MARPTFSYFALLRNVLSPLRAASAHAAGEFLIPDIFADHLFPRAKPGACPWYPGVKLPERRFASHTN
jgi:hypothetical protein